jgi:hypothetical protein
MNKRFLALIIVFSSFNVLLIKGMEEDEMEPKEPVVTIFKKSPPQHIPGYITMKRSSSFNGFSTSDNLTTNADENFLDHKGKVKPESPHHLSASPSSEDMNASSLENAFEELNALSDEEPLPDSDEKTRLLFFIRSQYPGIEIYNNNREANDFTEQMKHILCKLHIVEKVQEGKLSAYINTYDLTLEKVTEIFGLRMPEEYYYATLWHQVDAYLSSEKRFFTDTSFKSEYDNKLYNNAGINLIRYLLEKCVIDKETKEIGINGLTRIENLKNAMPWAFREHKRNIKDKMKIKAQQQLQQPTQKSSWFNSKPAWCIYSAASVVGARYLWEYLNVLYTQCI